MISAGGTLSIVGGLLRGNSATGEAVGSGGAILSYGDLDVTGTTIQRNSAIRAGGGIEIGGTIVEDASTADLDRVSLLGNTAGPTPGNGGGLHITGDGRIEVLDSVVRNNQAAREGGGLWNAGGTMTVTNTTVAGNTAAGDADDDGGGGLFNNGGTLLVRGSNVNDNDATGTLGSGGGLFANGGTLDIANSEVAANGANRAGGGIEALGGQADLAGVQLVENVAGDNPGNGGGLHVTGAGAVTVDRSTVADNSAAAEGGGLWSSATGTMTVSDSTITGNVASGPGMDQGGGGIYSDGGSLSVSGSNIRANRERGVRLGRGILNNQGSLVVTDTTIAGNDSTRAGGGIEANVGDTDLTRVVLRENTTGDNPGNGGGLHLTGAGTVDIDQSRVLSNTAANEGGGLWNSETGTTTVTNTEIAGNTAPDGPQVYNDGGTFTIDGTPQPDDSP